MINIKNKKGGTLTNWVTVVISVLLFIVVLQTSVLAPLNLEYNKTYSTGLDTSGLDEFQRMKETSHDDILGGEVEQSAQGLTLKDSWTVGRKVFQTLTSFISGSFLNNLIVDILGLPIIVSTVLVVLIWISLIMIIVYIFMKVVP